MGFRMSRRIKIAPGVRVNLTASKRGLTSGLSVGPKGAKVSVNSRGQKATTLSVPGTGISHVSRSKATAPSAGSILLIVVAGLALLGLAAALID
ncbi:MAG: DUF4236 domain-containing protein [Phenylobacterium sp.]|uniref:DUF4236 domain-containing protein n=1 Tax=Phenylobacterium sp. TaxID=1871053 RepID=UPI00391D380A